MGCVGGTNCLGRIWVLGLMIGFGLILFRPPFLIVEDPLTDASWILVEPHLIDAEFCKAWINCVLVAQLVRPLLAPAVGPSENTCRKKRAYLTFLLLPVMAAAACRGKPSGSVLANAKRGTLGAVEHCEEFDPVRVHRAKMEEKDFTDKMGVYDVVPRTAAAEKGCRVIRTRRVTVNKGSDEFRGLCGDTSTSLKRLTWR